MRLQVQDALQPRPRVVAERKRNLKIQPGRHGCLRVKAHTAGLWIHRFCSRMDVVISRALKWRDLIRGNAGDLRARGKPEMWQILCCRLWKTGNGSGHLSAKNAERNSDFQKEGR